MTVRYLIGDVFDRLADLEPGSVDLVLTSPPFLALRSYLPPDHPDKAAEIGSEATPADFIDRLLDVTEACARVLAPHGSICVELGDTYSGSGGAGGDYNPGGMRDGQQRFDGSNSRAYGTGSAPRPPRNRSPRPKYQRDEYDGGPLRTRDHDEQAGIIPIRTHSRRDRPGWPLNKSLCGIPEAFRLSLIYGFNILTGPHRVIGVDDYGNAIEQGRDTPRWRARNVVRWCRPNPPVGALGDKVRPATSDMIIACKGDRRYFDLDAVRTPFTGHDGVGTGVRKGQNGAQDHDNRPDDLPTRLNTHAGAPPLDHWWHDEDSFDQDAWLISTQPYHGSHYATWPEELCAKPILAMCPQWVCTMCGRPSTRLTEPTAEYSQHCGTDMFSETGRDAATRAAFGRARADGKGNARVSAEYETVGWTECDCAEQGGGASKWRTGIVLDPFCGSGTTLAVAQGLGRSAIGIDLDARNADLARQRVGMFLEVDADTPEPDQIAVGDLL